MASWKRQYMLAVWIIGAYVSFNKNKKKNKKKKKNERKRIISRIGKGPSIELLFFFKKIKNKIIELLIE